MNDARNQTGVISDVPTRLYFDLDGVFADFFPFVRQILKRDYTEMSGAMAWGRLSLVPNLFSKLPLIPDSMRLLDAVSHLGEGVEILTAMPLPTGFLVTAERDKRHWVARNLSPDLKVNTVYGGVNKYKFVSPGAVLVDDLERNLKPWEEAGGIAIHHTDVDSTLAALKALGLVRDNFES
ncbi:hypothetical protein [Novimethylophilus kurashikiensis]|nr:hypothetical protein [Novimethylophilus kurashikiensis]